MKKTSETLTLLVFWIGFLLLFAVRAHALFPTKLDGSHDPELSGNLNEIIGTHWFERKERILFGGDRLGKEELDTIYEAQLDQGMRNIPLLSCLLVRESLRALDRNDLEKAEFLCQYAKKFAPDSPLAYFTMGRIYWNRSKTLVNLVIREDVGGVCAILRNFRILFFKSLNILYLISGALLLTFVAFALMMGLKHLSLYFYDVRREFELTPVKLLVGLGKVFAFVVPVFLKLNVLWSLFYWTILMWGYMARRERQMLVIFLFVLVYVPWVLNEATDFLERPDPTILMTLYQANKENWNQDTRRSLKKWSKQMPEDTDILFSLGLLNKREGHYKGAERYYRDALQYDPGWPECTSNLGNVYLVTGRLEEAIDQYEQAISVSPKKASFYFNLHRAFARDSVLSSEKGGQALEMANRLDYGLVAYWTEIYSDNNNRSIVDDTIAVGRLSSRVVQLFQRRYAFREGILKAWIKGVPGRYDRIYPVFFLVFLLLFSLFCSRKKFPKRCPTCGTPSVKFFARKIQGDKVCFGCNRLFVKRDSIDPKMKEKRMKQVRRFGKRKAIVWRVLSFLFPGGGHLWKDQSIKGSLFVFFFFVFGLKFFYWNGIVHDPIVLGYCPGFWVWFVFILIFLLYYLGVLRSSLRIES